MTQPLFLFKLFGIPFFSYTTLIACGIVLALIAAMRQMRREGRAARAALEAFVWVAPLAWLGGRAAHVALNWEYYAERPAQIARTADGGLSFVGVFIGGALGLWWWSRRQKISYARAADWSALPCALLATGAWLGALLHGSQYGAPSDQWFALELRDTFGIVAARWPTQLIAAAWSALLGIILLRARPPMRLGQHALYFWGAYSVVMLLLDFTRGDRALYMLGLSVNQILYVVVIFSAIFILGRNYLRS